MTFLEQIFASWSAAATPRAAGDARGAGGSAHGAGSCCSCAGGAGLFAPAAAEEGRPLRAAGAQFVAVGCHGFAIMAEGLTVVPLYARQAPAELVAMMKDCWPSRDCLRRKSLADAIVEAGRKRRRISVSKCFHTGARAGGESCTNRFRRRRGDHHIYLGHFGRGQRRDADRGQYGLHAGLHVGTPGPVDEERPGRKPYFITCRFALRAHGS